MRSRAALLLVLLLAACSGGGGGSAAAPVPNPTATPTPAPTATPTATPKPTPTPTATPVTSSKFITPAFTLRIPKRMHLVRGRQPSFISSATLSVKISLTADSFGTPVTSIRNNPAITNVNGTGIPCTNGCTIFGPPSPPGMDTYTITTYDATNAGGNALDTLTSATFTLTEGAANNETATLLGIPASITIGALTSYTAGATQAQSIGSPSTAVFAVTALDADSEAIVGTYAQSITLSDPDTNGDGSSVGASCPSTYPTGDPASAATQVTLTSSTDTATFCYGGIAENPVTLTASATGAKSGTATFSPTLNAPQFVSGSATGAVVGTSPPQVQLIAPSGTGSTAGLNYSEAGWTEDPYDQLLSDNSGGSTCSTGGPFASYATIGETAGLGSTLYTVTAIPAPTPGDCLVPIGDGLTSNPSDAAGTLEVSYTATSIGVNGRPIRRR